MGGASSTVQVCTGHHAPKRRDIHMKTSLKTLLWAELITLILGCCVWLYGRRFWNGGSALLGLICAFVQLPLELCAYIAYVRCGARGDHQGKLFAAVSALAVWNFVQWCLFFMAHQ